MLQWLNTWIATQAAAPVWQAGARELVLVVNKKNKIVTTAGDSVGLLAASASSLKGSSVFQLVELDDQNELATAINYVRRSAQNIGLVPRTPIAMISRELTLRLTGNGHQPCVTARLQASAAHSVRIYLFEASSQLQTNETMACRENQHATPLAASHSGAVGFAQLADLSHEMKTPLNAILGFADTMREETFGPLGNERYADYVNDIHASGQHLMGLISSVLDVARVDNHGAGVKPVLGTIEPAIDSCVAMVRAQVENAGLKLRVEIERGLPEFFFDPQALRQIILNLLTNAIKFTSDGEISIVVTRARQTNGLNIVVSDTGIGMSTEQLAMIGSRFTQAQARGVRGTSGHGLGLNLAAALVEQCGGTFDLSSAPGEGLRASLCLPLIVNQAEAQVLMSKPKLHEATAADVANPGGRSHALSTQMERIDDFRRKINAERKSNAA